MRTRQHARGEEVPLARGEQPRAGEDVDVLIDQPADPHHQVVVDADALLRRARRDEIFDDALGGGGGADRFLLDVRAHLTGHVVARDERERDDGHDRGGNEGEEQLAVEAGADFAQQGTRARRSASDRAEDGREHEHAGRT